MFISCNMYFAAGIFWDVMLPSNQTTLDNWVAIMTNISNNNMNDESNFYGVSIPYYDTNEPRCMR